MPRHCSSPIRTCACSVSIATPTRWRRRPTVSRGSGHGPWCARARFDRLDDVAGEMGMGPGSVSGVLFDLGVSSAQLDRPERGFSYRADAPLDMRMDQGEGPTAADLVNTMSEAELARLFAANGEGRFASRIARAVVAARPVTTTARPRRRRALGATRRRAPPGRPPGAPRLSGPAGGGERRARGPRRRASDRHRRARPRRSLRGHLVPLGRGPNREGGLPSAPRPVDARVRPDFPAPVVRCHRASSCSGGRAGRHPRRWRAIGAPRAPSCVPSSEARPDGPGHRARACQGRPCPCPCPRRVPTATARRSRPPVGAGPAGRCAGRRRCAGQSSWPACSWWWPPAPT